MRSHRNGTRFAYRKSTRKKRILEIALSDSSAMSLGRWRAGRFNQIEPMVRSENVQHLKSPRRTVQKTLPPARSHSSIPADREPSVLQTGGKWSIDANFRLLRDRGR